MVVMSAKLRQGQLVCRCSTVQQARSSTSSGLPTRPSSLSRRPPSDIFTSFNVPISEPPPPSPPPSSVPIMHSSAYLQLTRQLVVHKLPRPEPLEPQDTLDDNVLLWALKKADKSLDEIEHNPPAVQKALYDMSRSPAGEAASKGVQAAAKLTMSATIEAAKVAAPAGKWALKQGFKAAVGLVGMAMEQERQATAAKRQQEKLDRQQQQQQRSRS